jgi:hypothetical protein
MYLDQNYLHIILNGQGDEIFYLNIMQGRSLDCGFIETEKAPLQRVFGFRDISFILEICEKKVDGGIHCKIKENDECGKIETTVDGRKFNCYVTEKKTGVMQSIAVLIKKLLG